MDFNSFGLTAKLATGLCLKAKEAEVVLSMTEHGGRVLSEVAKLGVDRLASVRAAMDDDLGAPTAGHVQKLIFVLQLLDKIADSFCELGNDYDSTIALLGDLLQARQFKLTTSGSLDEALRQKLTIHVPGWTDALLERVIGHDAFAAAVLDAIEANLKTMACNAGLLLLACSILSKLVKLETQTKRSHWMVGSSDRNLFALSVCLSRNCGESFSREPFLIGFPEAPGRQSNEPATSYDVALTLVQSFYCHSDEHDFAIVEAALFNEILDCGENEGDHYWSKKFVSDLWCFLARFAFASICGRHVELLLGVYMQTDGQRNLYLKALLARLSRLLARGDKELLTSKFDPLSNIAHLKAWTALDPCVFPVNFKNMILKDAAAVQLNKLERGKLADHGVASSAMQVLLSLWKGLDSTTVAGISKTTYAIWKKLDASKYSVKRRKEEDITAVREFVESLCRLSRFCLQSDALDAAAKSTMIELIRSFSVRSDHPDYLLYLLADLLRAHPALLPINNEVMNAVEYLLHQTSENKALELKVMDTCKSFGDDER